MARAEDVIQQIFLDVHLTQVTAKLLLVDFIHFLVQLAEVVVLENPISGRVILENFEALTHALLHVHEAENFA